MYDPIETPTYVAAGTSRITLGTSVLDHSSMLVPAANSEIELDAPVARKRLYSACQPVSGDVA